MLENVYCVLENGCKTLWGRGYKQLWINSLRTERRFKCCARTVMALKIEQRLSCFTGTHLLHKNVNYRPEFCQAQQHLLLLGGSLWVSTEAPPGPRCSSCRSRRFRNTGPRNPLKTHEGSRSSSHGTTSCVTLFETAKS